MDALAIFNCVEAVFWMTIGSVVLWRDRGSRPKIAMGLRLATIAGLWFILFGISDIFEVYTGAWYRPVSLLIFKATCIAALIACGVTYRLTRRHGRANSLTN